MNLKVLLICLIIMNIVIAGHAKTHKTVKGQQKHHKKGHLQSPPQHMMSASFEMSNIGNEDYTLDPKEAARWEKVTEDYEKQHNKAKKHLKKNHKKH